MRILSALAFCTLAALSMPLMLYLLLLGMAPMVPPLDYTGIFLYGPLPGFFIMPLLLIGAVLVRVVAAVLRRMGERGRGGPVELAAWVVLGLLLAIQGAMLADFQGLI